MRITTVIMVLILAATMYGNLNQDASRASLFEPDSIGSIDMLPHVQSRPVVYTTDSNPDFSGMERMAGSNQMPSIVVPHPINRSAMRMLMELFR